MRQAKYHNRVGRDGEKDPGMDDVYMPYNNQYSRRYEDVEKDQWGSIGEGANNISGVSGGVNKRSKVL